MSKPKNTKKKVKNKEKIDVHLERGTNENFQHFKTT